MSETRKQGLPWLEYLFLIPIAAGLAYTTWYYNTYGYLPQPYYFEPWGVYMDFFSVASFAHNLDAFNEFGTIYPPLSFALLKYISWGPCYLDNGVEEVRYCDYYGLSWLYIIYAINAVLVFRSFRKIDRRTAVPRSVAMVAGLPMTYALERGNLLLFTFTCILLAYGPLVRSARLRWLFAGLAVNFKVYLVGTIFAQLLRRRWRWFEGALLMTILVYLVSFAIYGEGSPKQIYENITLYAGAYKYNTLLDIWYPNSLIPLRTLLSGQAQFDIAGAIGSGMADMGLVAINVLTLAVVLSIIAAALAAWWRPEVVPMHRLVFLSIAMAMVTSEVGGYTQIFIVLFVLMERWRGFGRGFAIVVTYLLCTSLDFPIERIAEIPRDSYLSGRTVLAHYNLSIGVILRPILVYLVILALAWVTIRDVWADARAHGWRPPWRRQEGEGAITRSPPIITAAQ